MAGPLALFGLLGAAGWGAGCSDDSGPARPRIDRALPAPVQPGGPLVVEGEGFGEVGYVALGGRPLSASAWTSSRIEVVVPVDQRPGETVLVVTTGGRPTAPFAVEVAGTPRPERDGGRILPPVVDGGVVIDEGLTDGQRPDAAINGELVGEFLSDPAGMEAIRLATQPAPPGELVLEVVLPRAAAARWGLAFHLAWDAGLMELLEADPAGTPRGHADQIGPGRLAAGRLLDGRGTAFRLRFRLLGRGEGRITFPVRYRTLRDRANEPVASDFAEGTLRVRGAP